MAGDYIPFDHDFPEKLETLAIHEATGVSIGDIMLRLHKFWRTVDRQTTDGVLHGVGIRSLIVTCGGNVEFWEAVAAVGWLRIDNGSTIMPGFVERLGSRGGSARQRLKWAQQKRRQRGQSAECPQDNGVDNMVDNVVDNVVDNSGTNGRTSRGGAKPRIPYPVSESKPDAKAPTGACKKSLRFDGTDMATAEWMFVLIQALDPKARQPNLDGWANDIRLLREADGRTDEEIRAVFGWANADGFWKSNILSPAKLRKQFTTLYTKMKEPHSNGPRNKQMPCGPGQSYTPGAEVTPI